MENFLRKTGALIKKNKCGAMCAFLFLFMILDPLVMGDVSSRINYRWIFMVYILILIFVPYFITSKIKTLYVALSFGVPVLILRWLASTQAIEQNIDFLNSLVFFAMLGLEVYLLLCVMWYVSTADFSSREPVFGSIVVYLLIGIMFSDIYFIISKFQPETFWVLSKVAQPTLPDTLYFSFVTLTTLGYGDIYPVSPLVRRIISIEAVIGVLYVALFVGRVVAVFSSIQFQQVGLENSSSKKKKLRLHSRNPRRRR